MRGHEKKNFVAVCFGSRILTVIFVGGSTRSWAGSWTGHRDGVRIARISRCARETGAVTGSFSRPHSGDLRAAWDEERGLLDGCRRAAEKQYANLYFAASQAGGGGSELER